MAPDCPKCSVALTERFVPASKDGEAMNIDVCERCHGIWLDAHEIARLCPEAKDLTARGDVAALGERGKGIAKCPRCKAAPVETSIGGHHVDVCDGCGGMWLDKTEAEGLTVPHKQIPLTRSPAWLAPIARILDRLHDLVEPPGLRNAWPPKHGLPSDD
jgi:Zn-finger nucleic acid-binding protein